MFNPDDFDRRKEEAAELDKLLAKFQDCDLGDWDHDFVDSLTDRLTKFDSRIRISPREWQQLERMKEQYGVT